MTEGMTTQTSHSWRVLGTAIRATGQRGTRAWGHQGKMEGVENSHAAPGQQGTMAWVHHGNIATVQSCTMSILDPRATGH